MRLRLLFRALLFVFVAVLAGCKENGSGVKVTSFTFHGTRAVAAGQLKSVLATSASSKLPWGEKHYFSREQFEADLKRITAFYKDRGFPDARVTSFDAKLNADQTAVAVTINIDEGQPVRVQQIVYNGFEPLPEQHRTALQGSLPLKVGQPLDRALLAASREAALDEFRDHGFPYASVRLGESAGGSDHDRIVTLSAQPGPLTNFGPIEIVGNSSVSDNVVQRQLTYRPGRLFRQSALQSSQRRLYSQELFQFANVEAVKPEGNEQPAEIPTRVTLTEGKHRKVTFGVGYGSEEKARAQVDWRHVNFFGGARTATVLARYSALDRGVRLGLTQPYLFSPRYQLGLTGQGWQSREPAFDLDTAGGRITVMRMVRRTGGPILGGRGASMSLSAGYALDHENYSISNAALADLSFRDELIALGLDPRTGTGTGTRSAIFLDGGRNTTDNLLDAKRGYLASLHLEQAGQWLGGTYDYYELTGEGRFYQQLGSHAVAAVQVRGGSIDAFGDQNKGVPFFKRYFLGGATNLRGWGRFEVSPLSGAGLPIGGASFMNFSAELRAPVWGNLGAVVFLDGGNVWTNPWDFNVNDLRYDVGPGLRYNTPIGPIRVDLGYQLNPLPNLLVNGEPQGRRFRFHFSIGQAF
jgi:outer membrane protein insertion porin family/translocation and assembly module TamA